MHSAIHIGCSGYYYKDWRGLFYPRKLAQKEWLTYYANHFNTVEVNATFYRFPNEEMLKRWYSITPDNFKFTLKGSRYVTHLKKLKGIEENVERFFDVTSVLQSKLASILWQLPPSLSRNDKLLEDFCKMLSPHVPQIIEFRNSTWFDTEVFQILNSYNIGYCILSAPGNLPESIHITAPFSYIRFHGKEQWYNYKYSIGELNEWVEKIKELDVEQLFIYFNNDYHANAVENGKQLMDLLDIQVHH